MTLDGYNLTFTVTQIPNNVLSSVYDVVDDDDDDDDDDYDDETTRRLGFVHQGK